MQSRYPALAQRNFAMLWVGLLVSNAGTWMQNVAQSWLIYTIKGRDPIYLGWLGACFAVPMIVVPPFGGVIADRIDRVRLLYFTQTGAMLLAALLAALTWSGAIRAWHILACTFCSALLLAFDNPARQSLIPELVPREAMQNALSLNAATFTGAALIGPAIAGPLLKVVGAGWLFLLNAVSFLAVIGALAAMRDVPKHRHKIPSLRDAVFGGFEYVARERWLQVLLVLSAVGAVFARSYQQLLPVFADAVFRRGPSGFGTLLAAGGAGALIGALGISAMRDIANKGAVMVAGGFALCGSLAAFALCRPFALGVVLVGLIGVAATVFTTMIATMIQLSVPASLRGRVMSLYVITLIGLPSLGSLAVAAVAAALREGSTRGWAAPVRALLDVLGVGAATRALGVASGAPRAVFLGALSLAVVLAVFAPRCVRGVGPGGGAPETVRARPAG